MIIFVLSRRSMKNCLKSCKQISARRNENLNDISHTQSDQIHPMSLVAMIAHRCPIIYKDTIHNIILLLDTSRMLDTTKLIP